MCTNRRIAVALALRSGIVRGCAAILFLLSLAAGAFAESKEARDEETSTEQQEEKGPTQEKWVESEPDLMKLLKTVSDSALKTNPPRAAEEVVQKAIGELKHQFYLIAMANPSEAAWPLRQYRWSDLLEKKVARREKRVGEGDIMTLELELLQAVTADLRKTAVEKGVLKVSPDGEVAEVDANGDPVWRYRGPQGVRGTRPRYKGQEPIN